MVSDKRIFIAALDWGLGHATRCVPIIKELQKNNHLIIGVTSQTKLIFEEEFPSIQKINLPEYKIRYSTKVPIWLKLIFDWPRIKSVMKQENEQLNAIIKSYQIDFIISDNRFGLFSKKVHSVLITHQLFLKAPFLQKAVQYINKNIVLNFNEVWVPDYENETDSLSGELSHGPHYHPKVKYIGPQSRLEKIQVNQKKYDVLILLSGPEPQHSRLANDFISLSKKYPKAHFAMASAVINKTDNPTIDFFFNPISKQLSLLIAQSKKIICRSGYSTLMDMHQLDKMELLLMPTKGQTEQEYLAKYWEKKYPGQCIQLDKMDIELMNQISKAE